MKRLSKVLVVPWRKRKIMKGSSIWVLTSFLKILKELCNKNFWMKVKAWNTGLSSEKGIIKHSICNIFIMSFEAAAWLFCTQNNPFRFKIFENTCQEITWSPFTSRTARSVSITAYLGKYCIFEAQFLPGIDYLTESNLYCKPCPLVPVFPRNSPNTLPLSKKPTSWLCYLFTYSITSAMCLWRIFTHRSSSSSKIASFSFPPEPSVLYLPRENSENYFGFGFPPVLIIYYSTICNSLININ